MIQMHYAINYENVALLLNIKQSYTNSQYHTEGIEIAHCSFIWKVNNFNLLLRTIIHDNSIPSTEADDLHQKPGHQTI